MALALLGVLGAGTLVGLAALGFALYDVNRHEAIAQATAAANPQFARPLVSRAGRVAFVVQDAGAGFHGDLYAVNVDGSGLVDLTHHTAGDVPLGNDLLPAWSPDGRRLAFSADSRLVVLNAEGTDLTRPLAGRVVGSPSWSPDGLRLAASIDGAVAVVNADGSGLARLTGSPAPAGRVVWAPDGRRLAFLHANFASGRHTTDDLFVVNLDGSGLTRLPRPVPNGNYVPLDGLAWAPDGSQLAFQCYREGLDWGVFLVSASGAGFRALPVRNDGRAIPSWSPDGDRLAVNVGTATESDVAVLTVSAGEHAEAARLTYGRGGGTYPAWSPDGTRIAFIRRRSVMVMNADGSGLTTLADFSQRDVSLGPLVWQPAP